MATRQLRTLLQYAKVVHAHIPDFRHLGRPHPVLALAKNATIFTLSTFCPFANIPASPLPFSCSPFVES
jgi:hypothetical protein